MGCGACVQSNKVVQPITPIHSVELTLTKLIKQYQQKLKNQNKSSNNKILAHPIVSISQCKKLSDLIASNNGQLPQVRFKNKLSLNSAGAVANQSNQAGVGKPAQLLNELQRIIWKCLLILPDQIQNEKQLGKVQITPFKQQIPDKDQIVQNSFYQISLDVPRTFPSIINLNKNHLTILLRNLVNTICGIGYTQGMNFYAGFFLLCGFSPQQSYYILLKLFTLPNFFICHNFNPNFSQVTSCNNLLSKCLPQNLSSHLINLGITQQIYSFTWFLCSYLYTFDTQFCAIIWDWIIKSGCTSQPGGGFVGVVNIAIVIMQKLQQRLLDEQTPDGIMSIFRIQGFKKLFTQQQIVQIIDIVKIRSQQFQKNPTKYKITDENPAKFRQLFITKHQIFQQDKEFKKAVTTKDGYQKYMDEILGWSRNMQKKDKQIAMESEEVVIVGNPNVIKIDPK